MSYHIIQNRHSNTHANASNLSHLFIYLQASSSPFIYSLQTCKNAAFIYLLFTSKQHCPIYELIMLYSWAINNLLLTVRKTNSQSAVQWTSNVNLSWPNTAAFSSLSDGSPRKPSMCRDKIRNMLRSLGPKLVRI